MGIRVETSFRNITTTCIEPLPYRGFTCQPLRDPARLDLLPKSGVLILELVSKLAIRARLSIVIVRHLIAAYEVVVQSCSYETG